MAFTFSPPEYCRLFAQKKAYQGGVMGTPGPPPSYAPDLCNLGLILANLKWPFCEKSAHFFSNFSLFIWSPVLVYILK